MGGESKRAINIPERVGIGKVDEMGDAKAAHCQRRGGDQARMDRNTNRLYRYIHGGGNEAESAREAMEGR